MSSDPTTFDDDYQDIADKLAAVGTASEPGARDLHQEIEGRIEGLKGLLEQPPKNDCSRTKLKKGRIEHDGVEFEINSVFVEQTIQLADDLNLDEMYTARFLQRTKDWTEYFNRTELQSVVILYHTRRRNILDCVRFLFSLALSEETTDEWKEVLDNLIERLVDGKKSFSERCIESMATIRSSVQHLRDKEKHLQTLRIEPPPGFKEDLVVQIKFLQNQHESLACILYYLVKGKRAKKNDFSALLGAMASFDKYDAFTAHHTLPLFAFIPNLCDTESSPDLPKAFDEIIGLHKDLQQSYKEAPWPLRYVQAALLIWWTSEFNGLCNEPPSLDASRLPELEYSADVLNPTRAAMKDGGIEFLMAMAFDINNKCALNAAKEDLHRFLQVRVPPLGDASTLLNEFRQCLFSQLDLFLDGYIANMAEVLKLMKTEEEEDMLLVQRSYDYELERFFLLIHYVYAGRREAGISFWEDLESNLHGFLSWAATRQTPFMAATMSYAVASLSPGEECAIGAHRFLKSDNSPASMKARRTVTLSYPYIMHEIQSYRNSLESGNQALVPVNPYQARTMAPPPGSEPSPEMSMMLDGYLRLIGQIVSESVEAREYFLTEPDYQVLPMMFDLLNNQASTQLWDSIFFLITALLVDKSQNVNQICWSKLDDWALRPRAPSTALTLPSTMSSARPTEEIFEQIVNGVHPAEAWVRLLAALLTPVGDSATLKDTLPFPENLGSSNRTSGVDPYVDHVLGQIFANTTVKNLPPELPVIPDKEESVMEQLTRSQYKAYRHALQLSCLEFIHISLSTLNEDFFALANKNVAVDAGIRSSSLETYAKMHPFGRVMEHLLTEKCFNVLYEILQVGIEELTDAQEPRESAIHLVLYVIQIIDMALQMQPTFLQVIRPLVKQEDGVRRTNVSGNTFPNLEEAILYHLDILVSLGLYIGSAHYEVVLAALSLLEKLSVAPNLVAFGSSFERKAPKNRFLEMVEQSSDSRRIVFNFIHQWEGDPGDCEGRFELKLCILRLIGNSLAIRGNEYTLAHMLLGFGFDSKEGIGLSIAAGGIGSGNSLFHEILNTAQDCYEVDDAGCFRRDYCELKKSCLAVLGQLWKLPATSNETLYLLRANRFFSEGYQREVIIQRTTSWEGTLFDSPEFFNIGATLFCNFLRRRALFSEYAALEIRQLAAQGASTTVSSYLSTLLGKTLTPEGIVENPNILTLLDFLEIDLPESLSAPRLSVLAEIDVTAFVDEDESGMAVFDTARINELCLLKENEFRKNNPNVPEAPEIGAMDEERAALVDYLWAENQLQFCHQARLECLSSWADLCALTLEDCEFEGNAKIPFILQTLQTIVPKLEQYSKSYLEGAEILSSLAVALVSHLPFELSGLSSSRSNDVAGDRLYQLFRAALRCVQSPLATPKLREDLYNIALRYLRGMADFERATRLNVQAIRSTGDRLLEVVCNDAYAGEGENKVVALLLLDSLQALASVEGSIYVLESLSRQNFLVVLMDSIKRIGSELRIAKRGDIPLIIKSFKAATGFLVRIAETREGAGLVIDSGLFPSLRECELFSVDPDLGLGFDDPRSLDKYYDLLHDVVRVVTACVLSRGPQNQHVLELGKQFLSDCRSIAITVFKRQSNIGGQRTDAVGDLAHLVDCFVLLFSLTGYVEAEEDRIEHSIAPAIKQGAIGGAGGVEESFGNGQSWFKGGLFA